MTAIDRRQFLGGIAAAAAIGLAKPSAAIEPIRRQGKPVLKLSLAAYSFNRQLRAPKGQKPAMTLYDFIDFCASQGLEGTELTSYYFPEEVTADYLNSLKLKTHLAGLTISGGAIGNDFGKPDGPQLQAELDLTQRWVEHYAHLGAPAIRVFAGRVPKGDTEEATIKRCIGALEIACEAAGKKGVMLALENHGGITARADQMLKIVHGVKSPWLGVNFDSGNFRDGDDPYEELAKIAPYAVNAQIKVEVQRNRKPEPADLSKTVAVLKDAGYSGWVVLEYEKENPKEEIPRYLDELRQFIS